MAKVKCIKCGSECCKCWGCDTSKYINGLCPNCQIKEKENASPTTAVLQELPKTEESINTDRWEVA